jgi:hypothetical protein
LTEQQLSELFASKTHNEITDLRDTDLERIATCTTLKTLDIHSSVSISDDGLAKLLA